GAGVLPAKLAAANSKSEITFINFVIVISFSVQKNGRLIFTSEDDWLKISLTFAPGEIGCAASRQFTKHVRELFRTTKL
ncbi:hypothetical protein N9H39_04425, partial [Gammaproteobacteria bacterium]|nr:hypothetical protein [Gammaproteobacteria bacterium]